MPYPPEIPSEIRRHIEDGQIRQYMASDTQIPAFTTLIKMRTEARERVEDVQDPIRIAINWAGTWYQIDVIYPDKYSR